MFRFFTSDLRRNLTKVFCLTIGMAIGILLVAKIYFQKTYDVFLPDSDRLYKVAESVTPNGEYREYLQTPGATAPGLKRYLPQVESATRCTYVLGKTNVITENDNKISVDGIMMADSCFFDVLVTDMVSGNPHDVLAMEDYCMIPRSLAEKIGGDVIGKEITPEIWSNFKLTIGGIYEDFPLNSSVKNLVYLSLNTIPKISYDGRENWIGNDRYISYVKLVPGTQPDELRPGIRKMLEDNLEEEALKIYHYDVFLKPLVGLNSSLDGARLVVLLAIIMLLSSAVNYLLIVIGQVGKRAKEMAVRKCYGTGNGKIFRMVLLESLFPLLLSLGLAILIDFCLADYCRRLLGFTSGELFGTEYMWLVICGICIVLFVFTGVIPAWIYCRTPVAHAFKGNVRSRRGWKLAILAIQFFASGMILCLLIPVVRQYRMMGDADMGFDYKNIARLNIMGVSEEESGALLKEIRRLGFVEGVSTSYSVISDHQSGNNVWREGYEGNEFNIADHYGVNPNLFEVLGIEFVQGHTFDLVNDTTSRQVIVEERMVELLQKYFDEKDPNIVGQTIRITEHSNGQMDFTIVGVIENLRREGFEIGNADTRAGVFFPDPRDCFEVYIRVGEMSPGKLSELQKVIDGILGADKRYVYPYKNTIDAQMEPTRRFGEAVAVVGVAILVIALIGLIGYTTDEVQRRRKEIAIRKVSGTRDGKILRMFCIDIFKVAVPALVLGGAVSLIAAHEWLSGYTDRVSLAPGYTVLCIALLLLVIALVVTLNILKAVRTNPVEYLREE